MLILVINLLILSQQVRVNGAVAIERGKKIRSGDIVTFEASEIQVV